HHLARAHELVEPSRLLEACGRAADRSAAVGAWLEAARYASVALAAASALEISGSDLAALQFRAGYASLTAGDRETGIACLTTAWGSRLGSRPGCTGPAWSSSKRPTNRSGRHARSRRDSST